MSFNESWKDEDGRLKDENGNALRGHLCRRQKDVFAKNAFININTCEVSYV